MRYITQPTKLQYDLRILDGVQMPFETLVQNLAVMYPRALRVVEKCYTYTVIGELTGIGNVVPVAQMIKETGGNSEKSEKNNNFAGLAATPDGAIGTIATTIAEGVLQHYAHLYNYAVAVQDRKHTPLDTYLVNADPRYAKMLEYRLFGTATRWRDLSMKWNTGSETYGTEIINIANRLLSRFP